MYELLPRFKDYARQAYLSLVFSKHFTFFMYQDDNSLFPDRGNLGGDYVLRKQGMDGFYEGGEFR